MESDVLFILRFLQKSNLSKLPRRIYRIIDVRNRLFALQKRMFSLTASHACRVNRNTYKTEIRIFSGWNGAVLGSVEHIHLQAYENITEHPSIYLNSNQGRSMPLK